MGFLDPRKIQDILVPATAALGAIGAFGASVAAGIKWLKPVLTELFGSALAIPLTVALSGSAALLILWAPIVRCRRKASCCA